MTDGWHYTCEGKPMGPAPWAELRRLAERGLLRPTDLVWREGMSQWVRASSVQGLVVEFGGSGREAGAPGIAHGGDARDWGDEAPARRERRGDSWADGARPEIGGERRPPRDGEFLAADAREGRGPMRESRPRRRQAGAGAGTGVALWVVGAIVVAGLIVGLTILLVNLTDTSQPPLVQGNRKPNVGAPAPGKKFDPGAAGLGDLPPVSRVLEATRAGTRWQDEIGFNDAQDPGHRPCLCKVYQVRLKANARYVIVMESVQFDAYLRLVDEGGLEMGRDDDGGALEGFGQTDARLRVQLPREGNYRIVATTFAPGQMGTFSLTVREE